MEKKTGGPAFPGPVQAEQSVDIHEGMTLRDYFAAAALPIAWQAFHKGHLAGSNNPINVDVAEYAYQVADAMLKKRGEND